MEKYAALTYEDIERMLKDIMSKVDVSHVQVDITETDTFFYANIKSPNYSVYTGFEGVKTFLHNGRPDQIVFNGVEIQDTDKFINEFLSK